MCIPLLSPLLTLLVHSLLFSTLINDEDTGHLLFYVTEEHLALKILIFTIQKRQALDRLLGRCVSVAGHLTSMCDVIGQSPIIEAKSAIKCRAEAPDVSHVCPTVLN